MSSWDHSYDLVVVGSGGGGLMAAITAADLGGRVLLLEKQALLGGSTCMSGGMAWVPNNPIMKAAGETDSYEQAMAHFEAVVGDVGPASSVERRHAFVTEGPQMVSYLQQLGVRLEFCPGYSDYYSSLKGGHDVGRAFEPLPWNAKRLGPWRHRLQPGMAKSVGLVVKTNEGRWLSHFNRSPKAFAVAARVGARTVAGKVTGRDLLVNGASLVGQMLKVALDKGVDVRTEAPLDDLVVEDGRVAGVLATHEGRQLRIEARRGVLLAAGGFAHNKEMRAQYGGDQSPAKWSISNPGDTGEALQTAMRLGARTDFLDEAWWLPFPRTGQFAGSTLDRARQRPRTILVDADGKRFCNESNSYMEVGKAMYARNRTSRAVPCWLIFDDRYRKRYSHLRGRPGHFPQELFDSGRLKRAATLEELAEVCGIDPAGLASTVATFNEHARQGRDPEFGRGESAYNRSLGDPNRKVHPCLGPIDEPPYYASEVVPGDIGTCGGLLTDELARVLGAENRPIEGLYATGNITATVMGRHYLGPGASIANSMVFGYIAARHALEPTHQEDGSA